MAPSSEQVPRPIRIVREPLDQFGCRLKCVIAAKTIRDAAATSPRLVAHQEGERVHHLSDLPTLQLERVARSETPHPSRVIELVEGHRRHALNQAWIYTSNLGTRVSRAIVPLLECIGSQIEEQSRENSGSESIEESHE